MTQLVTSFNVRHSGGGNHQRLRNWVLCRRGPKTRLCKNRKDGAPHSRGGVGRFKTPAPRPRFPSPECRAPDGERPVGPHISPFNREGTNVPGCHSNRSAEIGSTRVAFLAGTQTATSATAHKTIGVRMKAIGSHFFTPNRNPVRNFVSQNAPAIPITSPIPANSIPWRITMLRMFEACAPRAMRTPSSWVRCWTE